MNSFVYRYPLILLAALVGCANAQQCAPEEGIAVQVLGSGGPIADDARASTGYLVWIDGQSRLLVDAGGGISLRFGEAGGRFQDLDVIALSHLHTDHSAALPVLLKSGSFSGRRRPLLLTGPGAGGPFPNVRNFVTALLGRDGAYGYLSGYLDGEGRLPLLSIQSFPVDPEEGVRAVTLEGSIPYTLDVLAVPHGIVPSLAYRVRVRGYTIVFGSDQNGSNDAFIDFARGADLLVMHMPIPEDADRIAKRLHATPRQIGRIAGEAEPRRLVLSHFMRRSLRSLDANVEAVRESYSGELRLANDLDCFRLSTDVDMDVDGAATVGIVISRPATAEEQQQAQEWVNRKYFRSGPSSGYVRHDMDPRFVRDCGYMPSDRSNSKVRAIINAYLNRIVSASFFDGQRNHVLVSTSDRDVQMLVELEPLPVVLDDEF